MRAWIAALAIGTVVATALAAELWEPIHSALGHHRGGGTAMIPTVRTPEQKQILAEMNSMGGLSVTTDPALPGNPVVELDMW